MAMLPQNSAGALVLDANVTIALCVREVPKYEIVQTQLADYAADHWDFYAPGVLVSETLYIICGKLQSGVIASVDHTLAIQEFSAFMRVVLPPPLGEGSLVTTAERIRENYGCSRSADSLYLALLEQLVQLGPARLLTFDAGLERQALQSDLGEHIHLLIA